MKVNDKVKVRSFGGVYTTYDELFEKLGFKNTEHNTYDGITTNDVFTIFNKCKHPNQRVKLLAIRHSDGRELLIDKSDCELFDEPLTVSKEFILEAHNAACSTWKRKLEEQFPSVFVKEELEVWKWYKSNKADVIVFRNSDANNYGIINSEWRTNLFCSDVTEWIPATPEEVETALINEAKKRGFVKGCKFIDCVGIERIADYDAKFFHDYKGEQGITLDCGDGKGLIFSYGKWATIIEQPTEMTVSEIEKKLGFKIKIVG